MEIVNFIRHLCGGESRIQLHQPILGESEKRYLNKAIDSQFVSSAGKFVDQFESEIADFTGSKSAVATVNGTAALHAALHACGVSSGDVVITQALTFVATCNAIKLTGADPAFVDVSLEGLGMCPLALENFLEKNVTLDDHNQAVFKDTRQRIAAVLPVHTFGHPVDLDLLSDTCRRWNLPLVEDAAESLGSCYKGVHTGLHGLFSAFSFNGNKIITTGGGGMILSQDQTLAKRLKHLTTTAKVDHAFEYFHDEMGFNYRLPNINAALGCSQLRRLPKLLFAKRELAGRYREYFENTIFQFVDEPSYAKSNFWLNAVVCPDVDSRNKLLQVTNEAGIFTRPVWSLMHKLPMYKSSRRDELPVSEWLEPRLVNLPSSPRL